MLRISFELFFINFIGILVAWILTSITHVQVGTTGTSLLLMFLCLQYKLVKVDDMKLVSNLLLVFLPVFLLPSGIRIINNLELLISNFFPIIFIIFISTMVPMVITAYFAVFLLRIFNKSIKKKGEC